MHILLYDGTGTRHECTSELLPYIKSIEFIVIAWRSASISSALIAAVSLAIFSEKARSISQKYALAGRKKRSKNGERRSKYEQIGEEYNLSGRQIARYVRLGSLDKSLLAGRRYYDMTLRQ